MIPTRGSGIQKEIGFAITKHCNLRCPHCIRDDVATVRSLPLSVFQSVTDQALDLFGPIRVSLTGGEPLLHPHLGGLITHLSRRDVPWRIVTNGWHTGRVLPLLDRHPPELVRLSLSGTNRDSHDEVRGRGSFDRVLLSAAILTSRRVPFDLSLIVDRRTRSRLAQGAELAETLGAVRLQCILPQPAFDGRSATSDLPLGEWACVRDEVRALRRDERSTALELAYGAPFDGPESPCRTKLLRRLYIDSAGRLCSCCQLSGYGGNEREVVADLSRVPLAEAWPDHVRRVRRLAAVTARRDDPADRLDPFPCLRCARSCGKLKETGGPTGSARTAGFAQRRPHATMNLVQLSV